MKITIRMIVLRPFGRFIQNQIVRLLSISPLGIATVSEDCHLIDPAHEDIGELPFEYLQRECMAILSH